MRYPTLDRFVYGFVIDFCCEHGGNGPILKEVTSAVDTERLRLTKEEGEDFPEGAVGLKTVESALTRLESGKLINIERDPGKGRRVGGRITVSGAVWIAPENIEERWLVYLQESRSP